MKNKKWPTTAKLHPSNPSHVWWEGFFSGSTSLSQAPLFLSQHQHCTHNKLNQLSWGWGLSCQRTHKVACNWCIPNAFARQRDLQKEEYVTVPVILGRASARHQAIPVFCVISKRSRDAASWIHNFYFHLLSCSGFLRKYCSESCRLCL